MSAFFKNPVVHGALVFILTLISLFIHSGSPLLQMTVGGVAAGLLAYLSGILG